MLRLTPELYAISAFDGTIAGGDTLETRELDFNLSRRSAIVINQITGQMHVGPAVAADHFTSVCQELDLDPDNLTILGHSPGLVSLIYWLPERIHLRQPVYSMLIFPSIASFKAGYPELPPIRTPGFRFLHHKRFYCRLSSIFNKYFTKRIAVKKKIAKK